MVFKRIQNLFLNTDLLIWVGILIVGISFRWFLVQGNNFLFNYDQARDAIISQEILTNLDIKVQGPSASGTGDAVYHGVLYYYLLGPLYLFFSGNPQPLTYIFGLLNLLTIVPIYLLATEQTSSRKYGYLAALMYAMSLEAAQFGTWLSNPSLAAITIPYFFFFLYRWYKNGHKSCFLLVMLFLGLSNQMVIYSVYLWVVLIASVAYRWIIRKKSIQVMEFFVGMVVYMGTITTMIVAQIKLWQAGLFNPFTIGGDIATKEDQLGVLHRISDLYLDKIAYGLLPTWPLVGLVIVLLVAIILVKKRSDLWILGAWFFSPIILLGVVSRSDYHGLVGILPALLVLLVVGISLIKNRLVRYVIVGLFLISNVHGLVKNRAYEGSRLAVQKDAYLKTQLKLVDYMYQTAEGEDFTLATFTVPYGQYTTWAYLLNWYGYSNYGYLPTWTGDANMTVFGRDWMKTANYSHTNHYALAEETPGMEPYFYDIFMRNQYRLMGDPHLEFDTKQYGALRVMRRLD